MVLQYSLFTVAWKLTKIAVGVSCTQGVQGRAIRYIILRVFIKFL